MRQKILIVVAHLHEDREQKTDRDPLQPMIGVHVASLLDRERYQVKLHNEMWHGAYPTDAIAPGDYALVFLSGLQVDFDRMRQLSYFFRRAGTTVVAGGQHLHAVPRSSPPASSTRSAPAASSASSTSCAISRLVRSSRSIPRRSATSRTTRSTIA
jgi:hypothetical protein